DHGPGPVSVRRPYRGADVAQVIEAVVVEAARVGHEGDGARGRSRRGTRRRIDRDECGDEAQEQRQAYQARAHIEPSFSHYSVACPLADSTTTHAARSIIRAMSAVNFPTSRRVRA